MVMNCKSAVGSTLSALRVRLDTADQCRRDGDYDAAERHERTARQLCLRIAATMPLKELESLRHECQEAARELTNRLREARGDNAI